MDSSDPIADDLTEKALAGNSALYDEILASLQSGLDPLWQADAPAGELLDKSQDIITSFADIIARLLADVDLAAQLVGAAEVARQTPEVPEELQWFPLDAPESMVEWRGLRTWSPITARAIRDLQTRNLVTPDQFKAMDRRARAKAFSTATVRTQQAVEKVHEGVMQAVQEGTGLQDFRQKLQETAETSTIGPAASENLLRTTVGQSFVNAKEDVAKHPLLSGEWPYRRRIGIADARQSELCHTLQRSGINGSAIYRADDPVWERVARPLSHINCRCGISLVTLSDAAKMGIEEAIRWKESGVPPMNPAFVAEPQVTFPKGWSAGGQ